MDSAKDIARDMLEAIDIDGSGFWGAIGKGFISFPVSLAYLGYDFMDTEHRRDNLDDKFRLARLVKKGVFNHINFCGWAKPTAVRGQRKFYLRRAWRARLLQPVA